jgi:putative GTP pyrophosphokinase
MGSDDIGSVDVVLAEQVSVAYELRDKDWHDAQLQVQGWLRRLFDNVLDGVDGSRLDPTHSRIKSISRTLDKLNRKCEDDPSIDVRSHVDVELHVQDIVGVKVLCKSPRDQAAALAALTESDLAGTPFQLVETKDYISSPKPSGYRAHHAIVEVALPPAKPVLVEIQIKTRLQDAWSELTHEDLYKPGAPISPSEFHKSVASHMASLLSVVDSMADELAVALETTISEDVRAVPHDTERQEWATVRTTGPRYALAVDASGRQGLISARAVRDLAHADGLVSLREYISVSTYIHVGDELEVEVIETDDARYFVPLALPARAPAG